VKHYKIVLIGANLQHKTTLPLSKPSVPKHGDYYYDILSGDVLIYANSEWHKSWWTTRSKIITHITADNSFIISSEEFAVYIDKHTNEIGLGTVKCVGRKFNKPLYIVEDTCELVVFMFYFSEFIVDA
jgi:hypothetical protein